ncbi:hypothetical protein GUJ93_ZPchr0006g41840 [Zizania palustris]|uniref:Uncharacterized protein n=1 Tax=Zizania palustris TaxID=103762 RepID=A0A8J5VXC1_ZIZPA|nr:hypothetical protein GUJ93_ZPchr0006g41840 [Zizania palustris]
MPATRPESYSMLVHWPSSSTTSSCNVTSSHDAFGDQMSGSYSGALHHHHYQSSVIGHGTAVTTTSVIIATCIQ